MSHFLFQLKNTSVHGGKCWGSFPSEPWGKGNLTRAPRSHHPSVLLSLHPSSSRDSSLWAHRQNNSKAVNIHVVAFCCSQRHFSSPYPVLPRKPFFVFLKENTIPVNTWYPRGAVMGDFNFLCIVFCTWESFNNDCFILFLIYIYLFKLGANYFTILYWFCHTSTCIWHGCTCVPHPEPPPTSLPIPSLWVIPVHQPLASCIMHWNRTSDSFHIWYYTCFNAKSSYPNHPTLALSHRVQKSVLYICVSFAVSHTGLSLPSF